MSSYQLKNEHKYFHESSHSAGENVENCDCVRESKRAIKHEKRIVSNSCLTFYYDENYDVAAADFPRENVK